MAGRRLSWLARNACQRRGRKSTDRHCGKVIEAQPTLGQISPSEAAMAPRGQTERRVGDYWGLLTRGETTRRGIECAFASAAAKRRPKRRGSFRIFARATAFCAAVKQSGTAKTRWLGGHQRPPAGALDTSDRAVLIRHASNRTLCKWSIEPARAEDVPAAIARAYWGAAAPAEHRSRQSPQEAKVAPR
jgi:hypothetical protein